MSELLQRKRVWVRDLAVDMDVSPATVRRDLKALADARQLVLVHGGAQLPPHADFSFDAKQDRNLVAKKIVARLAAELVADGDQVFLDSGTTCFELAAHLRGRQSLSVIVNSARLALELDAPGQQVIIVGGQYRPDRMDTVGPIALATVEQLRGYQAFIGADGLSMDFGPSASDIDSAHFNRLAVHHARETVLLVDHSKFESASLFRIVEWDRISRLVTDQRPDRRWRDFLDEHNIDLICPPPAVAPTQGPPRDERPLPAAAASGS